MQRKPRTIRRLPAVLEGGKVNFEHMAGINLMNAGGPYGTVSGFEAQQCCLNLQSTIQVLEEALNANTSQLEALKLELETVKKENERVIAELHKTKPGNPESTSIINGIMKSVAGVFRS